MTFWIVTGALLVALLAAMALMDRRAKARGARLSGDIAGGLRGASVHGNVDAHRGADGQGQRTGLGGVSGM
ncbi:hypothetical protein O2V63_01560 [Modestobacter sp. VKM Ac-2977]|uniref:hypothetical protein n=1 Tax=Modestobacter sp. VKM Ac-2977 TaxID=3004131 RepID=UPI0022AAE80D|nr:hypothetical protein [Modestobacter sp. VKM Ac-2977]MCZ2819015.1 hypothetical protein [Modestobacter sp. VKM Ac-2977]